MTPNTFEIIIIGAGFGGVGMAMQLKQAHRHNFLILEKGASVGGTWRDNTYPGAACDVESHLYSYSFAPKSDWSRRYSPQEEIQAYIEDCVQRYELKPHLRLNTEVHSLRFDDGQQLWLITLANGETLLSRVVVTATGQLNQPSYPNIPGIEEFQGSIFHSARWNHNANLKQQKVGVIGTGASAIQFVPRIVPEVAQLCLFQRSAPWVIPKSDRAFSPWQIACFKYIPGARRLYRTLIYLKNEARALAFTRFSWILKYGEWRAKSMMKRDVVDASKRQSLLPDYPIGCNRILLANDWYSAVNAPHVDLVTNPIQRITSSGVETADGNTYELDVLILATGFKATEFLSPMSITGREGIPLNQAWQHGAEAYKGISIAGFPNLFMLYGPNTNLSHSSILIMLEAQIHYVLRCLDCLDAKKALSMDVKKDRQQRYVTHLQANLKDSVWASGCNSWYLNSAGRNVVNWFGFTFTYRNMTRRVKISDYHFQRGKAEQ